jgi:hypothetical protein
MRTVLKARRLAPLPRLARAASADSRQGTWRTSDLPAGQQAELGARLIRAERGEGLLSFDDAMVEVDRMVEEILAVVPAPSR